MRDVWCLSVKQMGCVCELQTGLRLWNAIHLNSEAFSRLSLVIRTRNPSRFSTPIQTRKRHLFRQRHLCDSLSIYFSTPVNNYDRLHLLLAPILTFLLDHTASIKKGTCYVSKTNGFEIRPSLCQKTIGWPHHSRFTSARRRIWSKTAVRPQTGHTSIVAGCCFSVGYEKPSACVCHWTAEQTVLLRGGKLGRELGVQQNTY